MNLSSAAVQKAFFFLLLGGATVFFFWVMRDFLFPVFWAAVFALLLKPAYEWLRARLIASPSLAAGATVMLFLLLIIMPLAALAAQLAREAFEWYQYLSQSNALSNLAAHPWVMQAFEHTGLSWMELSAQLSRFAQSASAWLFTEAVTLSTATATTLLKALLMLYLLFFFLRDGEAIGRYLAHRSPLQRAQTREFFARFASIARAITRGTFVTALLQGLVGGLLFWIAGVSSPVLWGSAMALLSLIPAVGPFLVWIPVGLWLLFAGETWQGILVLAGGALVISPLDNLLRPALVGREVRLPEALILVSILGGIATFGITGIVVGPLAAAFALAAWDYFAEEYGEGEEFAV